MLRHGYMHVVCECGHHRYRKFQPRPKLQAEHHADFDVAAGLKNCCRLTSLSKLSYHARVKRPQFLKACVL